MKIAVFTDVYAPWATGGICSSIRAQKDALEKLGHNVTIFCPGNQADTTEQNVICVPTLKPLKINDTPIAARPTSVIAFILQRFPNFDQDFDLVHVHYEAGCSIAGVLLAKDFNLPLVQTMHGREDRAIDINVPMGLKTIVASGMNMASVYCLPGKIKIETDDYQAPTIARAKMWELMVNHANQADIIITPSSHFAKKLAYYGVEKPIRVVSNGVNANFLQPEYQKRELNTNEPLKIVWNSRISQEKRIMPFLRALKLVQRQYELYLYGDGNEAKKARTYIKQNKLNVHLMGHASQEEILRHFQDYHLSVMTSYNFDTQGMTLLEAEATGLPVLFCDPDMQEIVPTGSYILASSHKPADIAAAIDAITPEQITSMSEIMLAHRHEVLQEGQTAKLLDTYLEAQNLHLQNTNGSIAI